MKIGKKAVEIPSEILLEVCTYLPPRDLLSLARTAKPLTELALDDALWRTPKRPAGHSEPTTIAALQMVRGRAVDFEKSLYRTASALAREANLLPIDPPKRYHSTTANTVVFLSMSGLFGSYAVPRAFDAAEQTCRLAFIGSLAVCVTLKLGCNAYQKASRGRYESKKLTQHLPESLFALRARQVAAMDLLHEKLEHALEHSLGGSINFEHLWVIELDHYAASGVCLSAADAESLLGRLDHRKVEWQKARTAIENYGTERNQPSE